MISLTSLQHQQSSDDRGTCQFFSRVYQLTGRQTRVQRRCEEGQKIHHRALSLFSFSDLRWRCFYFGFARLLFGGAYVCTNVCHSEDEVLLFQEALRFVNEQRRTSVPRSFRSGCSEWDGEVWCLPVTFVCAGEVVLQSKRCLWTATSSCPNCP